MTVAELIEQLKQQPQDAQIYVHGRDGEPCIPHPRYADWGNPEDPDRGVYL